MAKFRYCSGVTRGAGARGQGILTVPPEKSQQFLASIRKQNRRLSLKISADLLFSHHPTVLHQSLNTTTHGFGAPFTQYFPPNFVFRPPSLGCARGWPPSSAPFVTPLGYCVHASICKY